MFIYDQYGLFEARVTLGHKQLIEMPFKFSMTNVSLDFSHTPLDSYQAPNIRKCL